MSAFILNLLVSMMILVPCRDHGAFAMSGGQVGQGCSETHLYQAGQGHEDSDDDCSPLCTCACCASVSSRVEAVVVAGVGTAPVVKKFPVYITPDYKADRSAVWQPPRLG